MRTMENSKQSTATFGASHDTRGNVSTGRGTYNPPSFSHVAKTPTSYRESELDCMPRIVQSIWYM